MELNAELFKQYFELVTQKIKNIGELKYCQNRIYRDFDYMKIENNKLYVVEYEGDWNREEEIPNEFLTMSLKEIQEMFDKKYGEMERRSEQRKLEQQELNERKQYEALKAKFENGR
jgi:hypothetical protein